MKKICYHCKKEKLLTNFPNDKSCKDGTKNECKECCKRYLQRIYDDPIKHAEFLKKRKESRRRYMSKPKNAERVREVAREYRKRNRDRINARERKRFADNSELRMRKRESDRRYHAKNKERAKAYYHKNKERIMKNHTIWCLNRRKTDIHYRTMDNLRSRINHAIKKANAVKSAKTEELIGCTVDYLHKHLEKQFKEGMSWNNRKEWHIDHIIPVDYYIKNFDFTDFEVQKKCFHYTNMQPLWKIENIRKGNKIL